MPTTNDKHNKVVHCQDIGWATSLCVSCPAGTRSRCGYPPCVTSGVPGIRFGFFSETANPSRLANKQCLVTDSSPAVVLPRIHLCSRLHSPMRWKAVPRKHFPPSRLRGNENREGHNNEHANRLARTVNDTVPTTVPCFFHRYKKHGVCRMTERYITTLLLTRSIPYLDSTNAM